MEKFLLLLGFVLVTADDTDVELNLNIGNILGKKKNYDGHFAEVYESIPYAQPPLGNLRFEMPEPISELNGTHNSSNWNACPSLLSFSGKMAEDCLYMKVIIPLDSNGQRYAEPLPTVFWVHGGSYNFYSNRQYYSKNVTSHFGSKKIIFVAPNYRLSIFGFLTQLHPDLPGNFGFADIVQAIRVMLENSEVLGIDRKRITIAGESAGAAAASLLAVSPFTKDIFSAAILSSGSSQADWAVRTESSEIFSSKVIVSCNCNRYTVKEMKECMKKMGNQELFKAIHKHCVGSDFYESLRMGSTYVTPVVDSFMGNRSFIPDRPEVLVKQFAHVPALITSTKHEREDGIIHILYSTYILPKAKIDDVEKRNTDLANMMDMLIAKNVRSRAQVIDAVVKRYLKDFSVPFVEILPKIGEFLSADLSSASYEEGMLYASNNQTVYGIMTSIFPDEKTVHGNDMIAVFGSKTFSPSCPFCDKRNMSSFAEKFADILANFIVNRSVPYLPVFTLRTRAASELSNDGISPSDWNIDDYYFWRKTIPVISSLHIYPEKPIVISYGSDKITILVLSIAIVILALLLIAQFVRMRKISQQNK